MIHTAPYYAAKAIVEEACRATTSGNYIMDISFLRESIRQSVIDEIWKREEVADLIVNGTEVDINLYTKYCPNIDD